MNRKIAIVFTTVKNPATCFARGFTLIELLLVLVILAVLAAVVVPKFTRRSEQARLTAAACTNRHRTSGTVSEPALWSDPDWPGRFTILPWRYPSQSGSCQAQNDRQLDASIVVKWEKR